MKDGIVLIMTRYYLDLIIIGLILAVVSTTSTGCATSQSTLNSCKKACQTQDLERFIDNDIECVCNIVKDVQ